MSRSDSSILPSLLIFALCRPGLRDSSRESSRQNSIFFSKFSYIIQWFYIMEHVEVASGDTFWIEWAMDKVLRIENTV